MNETKSVIRQEASGQLGIFGFKYQKLIVTHLMGRREEFVAAFAEPHRI